MSINDKENWDKMLEKFDDLSKKIDDLSKRIQDPPGHFWIILLLLAIATKVGAC
jgi:hypothetical protein